MTKIQQNIPSSKNQNVIDYYVGATMDYRFWSKEFNMHFGYFKLGMNPFSRKKMLEEMNAQVVKKLQLKPQNKVLDLGCGLAATSRFAAKNHPETKFLGITIVPWQVQKAKQIIEQQGLENQIKIEVQDYNCLKIKNQKINAIYAIESICHAENKKQVLSEMHRVLKPNGKFCIADGFLKIPQNKTKGIFGFLYRKLCKNWAMHDLENIHDFEKHLKDLHFKNIQIQEISWNIAPSVLHAPFVILTYLIYALFGKVPLKKQNLNNLKASFLALFTGLFRKKFGYYLIWGEKNTI